AAAPAPCASWNPSLTSCTFVPPATTLGMSGATVSATGGGGPLGPPRPRPRPPAGASSSWAHANVDPSRQHTITISAFDFIASPRVLNCEGRLHDPARAARTSSTQSLARRQNQRRRLYAAGGPGLYENRRLFARPVGVQALERLSCPGDMSNSLHIGRHSRC